MLNIALCNLNLAESETAGCLRIQAALAVLAPDAVVHHVHWEELRAQPSLVVGAHALVLGPQGSPFSAYDPGFLPWLRSVVEGFEGPVLGVCGGMQALALAWGGELHTASGEALGNTYDGMRKIRGPLPVTLEMTLVPGWMPTAAKTHLSRWEAHGAQCFESHVEQVLQAPADFARVAHSQPTPVEAMMHRTLPIMASQFHPELGWDEGCAAGRLWLDAWLEVVRDRA